MHSYKEMKLEQWARTPLSPVAQETIEIIRGEAQPIERLYPTATEVRQVRDETGVSVFHAKKSLRTVKLLKEVERLRGEGIGIVERQNATLDLIETLIRDPL